MKIMDWDFPKVGQNGLTVIEKQSVNDSIESLNKLRDKLKHMQRSLIRLQEEITELSNTLLFETNEIKKTLNK